MDILLNKGDFMKNEELILKAEKAMENAYVPYSHFKVGAALLMSDGSVFTGCNIENSSYGATICAERTAMAKAVSEGRKDMVKIAIVSSSADKTYPCGICRQVMAEFMPKGSIVLKDKEGKITEETVESILPKAFSL